MVSAAATFEPVYSIFQDEEDFRELLSDFYESVQERRGLLRESMQGRQIGTLRVHAHQLKGSGGGYGFEDLTELAARLEEACKQSEPDLNEIGSLVDDLVSYMSRIRI
ncbi:hypothetical protein GC163_08880 [bacterium]|nr:hypothetical protein [bacterium]